MKILLSKKYLNEFDLKKCTKEVYELFDEYHFLKTLIDNGDAVDFTRSEYFSIVKSSFVSNKELSYLLRQESLDKVINCFEEKIEQLKNTFTLDELKIFELSIIERIPDINIEEEICKYSNTYYNLKKSCYVKTALKFNLFKETIHQSVKKISINNIA